MGRILLAEIGYNFYIAGEVHAVEQGSSGSFLFTAMRGTDPVVFDYTTNLPGGEWTFTDNGDGTFEAEWSSVETAGPFTLTVDAVDGERYPATRTYAITVIAAPLEITGSLDNATVGTPYSDTLPFAGGISPYSILPGYALPDGLIPTLAGGDGSPVTVSGTPTGAGLGPGTSFSFDVSITVEDSSVPPETAIFEQTITITVTAVTTTFSSLPNAVAGDAYSGDADATGGTGGYTFTKQAGPTWMSVNSSSGAITGTPGPSDLGTGITVTVRATDSEGNYDDVTDTIDVTLGTYSPWDVSSLPANVTASNGDFRVTRSGGSNSTRIVPHPVTRTVGPGAGKFALRFLGLLTGVTDKVGVGFRNNASTGTFLGNTASGWGFYYERGSPSGTNRLWHNNAQSVQVGGISNATQRELWMEVDMENGDVWFGASNFGWYGDPSTGTGAIITNLSGTLTLVAEMYYSGYIQLLDPSQFTEPPTAGFTPGWPD